MDPTFGKIIDMLPEERCVHHLHPTGSMIVLYVVVKMDIGVIAIMHPLIMLTQILVLLMILIGLMVKNRKNEASK